MLFAFSIEGRFGDFLEQNMRLAVDNPIALIRRVSGAGAREEVG
jgi:hypothetical protein